MSRRCLGKVLWVRKEGARCEVGNDNDPTSSSFPASAGRPKIEPATPTMRTFAPLGLQTQPLTALVHSAMPA